LISYHYCAELLTQASRQIMLELVEIIFRRLGELPAVPLSPSGMHTGAGARMAAASPLASDIAAGAEAFHGGDPSSLRAGTASAATPQRGGSDAAAAPGSPNCGGAGAQLDGAAAAAAPDAMGGAAAGRGLPTPQPGACAGAPSSSTMQEGSGTKAAGGRLCLL